MSNKEVLEQKGKLEGELEPMDAEDEVKEEEPKKGFHPIKAIKESPVAAAVGAGIGTLVTVGIGVGIKLVKSLSKGGDSIEPDDAGYLPEPEMDETYEDINDEE